MSIKPLLAGFKTSLKTSATSVPHLVAFLSLILLALVTFLLWLEMRKRFPMLPPGVYAGTVDGAFDGQDSDVVRLIVDRPVESEDLSIVVVRTGWAPQTVSAALPEREGAQGATERRDWLLPITVDGVDGKLRFIGAQVGPGTFTGRVENLMRDRVGTWSLKKIETPAPITNQGLIQEIRHWLLLSAELGDTEQQITEASQKAPVQRAEIEKLTGFVTEGERLKASAEEKFAEVKGALGTVQGRVKERQDEARRLEEQTMLSQRLTGMGRLVSLARESLEREGRWIESMLRADSGTLTPDLEVALRRAEKVQRLKEQLAAERAKIAAMRASEAPSQSTEPTRSLAEEVM